jgi:predicted glutamine amidotransferase
LRQQTCPGRDEQISGGGIKISSPRQKIAMAASVPLTEDGWEPMETGTVVALKDGEIAAASYV